MFKTQPKTIGSLLMAFDIDKKKYISREWQDYAYRLAMFLDDLPHKSLYMRLAKVTPRAWMEEAKNYITDAYEVKSKGRLFMWKLKQVKKEREVGTRFLVSGVVQKVGFRYWLKGEADKLAVDGWVKNLEDGRIEGVVHGAKAKLVKFFKLLSEGPALAKVKDVSSEPVEWRGEKGFAILK